MTEEIWRYSVGSSPHKVTVFEMATRKRVLYLQWRARGNWQYESLRTCFVDEEGKPLRGRARAEMERWAREQAEAKFARLKQGTPDDKPEDRPPLTLGETWAVISDADTGKYPTDTPHRREVKRELSNAARILGEERTWDSLTIEDMTKVWRRRIQEIRKGGKEGMGGALVTIKRVLAVAQSLRDRRRIALTACAAPSDWQEELRKDWRELSKSRKDYEPHRPRHTLDEMRQLLKTSQEVDPRFGLLYQLGAEIRLGQVLRCHRTDLMLEAELLRVHGQGKKGGVTIELTEGQLAVTRAALEGDGYLAHLETAYQAGKLADYPLFPGGQLPGGRTGKPRATVERHGSAVPIGKSVIDDWFREAEKKAKPPIEHIPGRGAYGVKRTLVDGAKAQGISREGLKAHGGWSSSQVPDEIYADSEAVYARKEAKEHRAKLRGETE